MQRFGVVAVVLACAFAVMGCGPSRYTRYEREGTARADTIKPMTKEDVIALSNAKVGDDVIIRQIEVSHSYFELGAKEIIDLANAGVSEKVIDAMIKTGETAARQERDVYYYAGYPYWYPWYPWYPTFAFSIGYWTHRPFFVHRHVYVHRPIWRHGFPERSPFHGSWSVGARRPMGRHR